MTAAVAGFATVSSAGERACCTGFATMAALGTSCVPSLLSLAVGGGGGGGGGGVISGVRMARAPSPQAPPRGKESRKKN